MLATVFDLGHDEFVLVKDIEVWSCCEHHLVPFTGVAHVGYIPNRNGKITGLSKLARLVDLYAKRPQVQERLTTQVADALSRILEPRGVIVVIECEHLCMTMRGVRKPGSKTITSAVRGQLRDPATRAEAMQLITSPARWHSGARAPLTVSHLRRCAARDQVLQRPKSWLSRPRTSQRICAALLPWSGSRLSGGSSSPVKPCQVRSSARSLALSRSSGPRWPGTRPRSTGPAARAGG